MTTLKYMYICDGNCIDVILLVHLLDLVWYTVSIVKPMNIRMLCSCECIFEYFSLSCPTSLVITKLLNDKVVLHDAVTDIIWDACMTRTQTQAIVLRPSLCVLELSYEDFFNQNGKV